MPRGNPNPSPENRFKPGNPGGGKTSLQRKLEYEAAEMAAKIRHKMISVIAESLEKTPEEGASPLDPLKFCTADVLRMMKEAEDRAHGTPKQSIEHTGEDGGPMVFQTIYEK